MARLSEIPFGNSLTGLQLTPAQRPRQLNRLARSLTVTGYASVRAYGTTNLKSSKAQHLACVCHPPKSAPNPHARGDFWGDHRLKASQDDPSIVLLQHAQHKGNGNAGRPLIPRLLPREKGRGESDREDQF